MDFVMCIQYDKDHMSELRIKNNSLLLDGFCWVNNIFLCFLASPRNYQIL